MKLIQVVRNLRSVLWDSTVGHEILPSTI